MKMDEEWPDHFEERSRPSRAEQEEAGERKLDAMANMIARPQTLQDYLHDQLGWFELDPPLRAMAERIIYNLDTNGYLQGRLEDLLGPGRDGGGSGAGPAGAGVGAEARPARRRPPATSASACSCSSRPACRYYEQLRTLISNHLEDLEHNRLPVISRRTGLLDRTDPADARRAAQAQPEARRRVQRGPRPAGHARRLRRAGRGGQVPGAAGRRAHAEPVHQPLLPQAFRQRPGQRRRRGSTSSGRSIRPNG